MVWVFRTDSWATSYVFGYCWNIFSWKMSDVWPILFVRPNSRNLDHFALLFLGKISAPLLPYSPSSQILIGELVKRMSIISDSQEDVRNLCQPRDGGRDGAWRPGKVPLQRAGLRKLHREEVPCNLLSRASAASSLYEYQSHTVESSIAVTYVTFTLKLTVQYLHGFTNARLQEFLFRLWMDNISEENPLFQRFQPGTRQPYDQLLLEIINQGKDDLEKAWFRSEHSEELINEDGALAVLFAKVV